MLKPLVILGAGGFARETLDIVDAINGVTPTWDCLGFIVDSPFGTPGQLVNGKPILGDSDWLEHQPGVSVVCGVGAPATRARMVAKAQAFSVDFATLIHPSVIRTRWIEFGHGVIVAAGCILTNNITVGDHVHLNLACTVGHDVVMERLVTTAPGVRISGNVRIRQGAYVGTGVHIIEKMTVGEWSIVGAGSTVVKDVPPNTTVVGVPAHVINERPSGWQTTAAG